MQGFRRLIRCGIVGGLCALVGRLSWFGRAVAGGGVCDAGVCSRSVSVGVTDKL